MGSGEHDLEFRSFFQEPNVIFFSELAHLKIQVTNDEIRELAYSAELGDVQIEQRSNSDDALDSRIEKPESRYRVEIFPSSLDYRVHVVVAPGLEFSNVAFRRIRVESGFRIDRYVRAPDESECLRSRKKFPKETVSGIRFDERPIVVPNEANGGFPVLNETLRQLRDIFAYLIHGA